MLENLLEKAFQEHCSDIHLSADQKPAIRKDGKIYIDESMPIITKQDLDALITRMLNSMDIEKDTGEDIDLCFSYLNNRYRTNIYTKQNKRAVAVRVLSPTVPTLEEMGLPEIFKDIMSNKNGLVLVTGPTGSGKSTTLAAMLNYINYTECMHILTFEDPIEFLYKNGQCIVSQREVGHDVSSFSKALKSALREDPDIILVGEMRDLETISSALTAAETGHLVLSTLHTMGSGHTINRIIDVFPPHQQQQIRIQLANTLRAVISQVLLPKANGEGRIAAFEIMIVNQAISSCIKQGKMGQIYSSIQTGVNEGMITLDKSINNLIDNRLVKIEDITKYIKDKDFLKSQYE